MYFSFFTLSRGCVIWSSIYHINPQLQSTHVSQLLPQTPTNTHAISYKPLRLDTNSIHLYSTTNFIKPKMASLTKSDDRCSSKNQVHDTSSDEDEELFELDLALMDEVRAHGGYRDNDSKKEALLSNCLMPVTCISNAKPINDLTRIDVNASIGLSFWSTTDRSRRSRSCEFWIRQPTKVASSRLKSFIVNLVLDN
jgi:hypothetical protein